MRRRILALWNESYLFICKGRQLHGGTYGVCIDKTAYRLTDRYTLSVHREISAQRAAELKVGSGTST